MHELANGQTIEYEYGYARATFFSTETVAQVINFVMTRNRREIAAESEHTVSNSGHTNAEGGMAAVG
jgi:hypothetical protein